MNPPTPRHPLLDFISPGHHLWHMSHSQLVVCTYEVVVMSCIRPATLQGQVLGIKRLAEQHVRVKHHHPLLFGVIVLEVVDYCSWFVVCCIPVFQFLIPGILQKPIRGNTTGNLEKLARLLCITSGAVPEYPDDSLLHDCTSVLHRGYHRKHQAKNEQLATPAKL